MVYVEPTFPRGKKHDLDTKKESHSKKKFKKFSYGASVDLEEKPKKLSRRDREKLKFENVEKEREELEHHIKAAPLSYKTVQQGMLILGSVYKINPLNITVSLPGRMYGTIAITSISKSYSKRLQEVVDDDEQTENACPTLENLYKPGDLVCVKVVDKGGDNSLNLSLSPSDINSEIPHKALTEGLIITAAISEIEDHGYIMETGIRNVRAFLPLNNIKKKSPKVGQNIHCFIESVTQSSNCSTVILKAFKSKEERTLRVVEDGQINLDLLFPGTNVQFTVTTTLPLGLQGTILDDCITAYVNQNHLTKPTSKMEDYSLFKMLDAKILYILPITKQVFVTLSYPHGNKITTEIPCEIGSVIEDAKVINRATHGILFSINKKWKAFLPKSYLKSKINDNFDEDVILSKYQPNSIHRVRILRYEMFDRIFICTDDELSLQYKYFKATDLVINRQYECKIVGPIPSGNGYYVKIDNVRGVLGGFNMEKSINYRPKQTILVRVQEIDEERNTVQVNNRNEYMNAANKILSDIEKAAPGKRFLGTITKDASQCFTVNFFNNIVGVILKRHSVDYLYKNLKPGFICEFQIDEIEDGKPLKLLIKKNQEFFGEIKTVKVTGCYDTGVEIVNEATKECGSIPKNYLSDFMELNHQILKSYQEGDILEVAHVDDKIYSLRDVDFFKHIKKDTRVGNIIKANIIKQNVNEVLLKPMIKGYYQRVNIDLKTITDEPDNVQLEEDQVVLLKVVNKTLNPFSLEFSAKLKEVCVYGPDGAANYVGRYLKTLEDLRQRLKALKKSIANLEIGQNVTATIIGNSEESSKLSFSIAMENGTDLVYAVADKDSSVLYSDGQNVSGKVIWIEYEKSLVHLCIKKKHLDNIDDDQTIDYSILKTESAYTFKALCTTQYVKVGYLKQQKGILVITPIKYHYNNMDSLPIKKTLKVMPVKSVYGKMIVLEESIYESMKNWQTILAKKPEKTRTEHVKQKKVHVIRDIQLRSKGAIKEICLPEFKEGQCERILEWHDHYYLHSDDDDDGKEQEVENKEEKEVIRNNTEITEKELKDTSIKPNKTQIKKKKNSDVKQNGVLKIKKEKLKKSIKTKKKLQIPQLDGSHDSILLDLFQNQLDGATDFQKKNKNNMKDQFKKNKIVKQKFQKNIGKRNEEFKKINSKQEKVKVTHADVLPLIVEPKKPKQKENLKLPGVDNFWSNKGNKRTVESSSDEDEDEVVEVKRKKLSSAEKFQAIKDEENRVRQIEDELADPVLDPHTPDHFDRLLLASPNSSLLWIKYMIFHMEAAELDKARSVAQRAVKIINFREEGERLNVWIALLNLEIRYGTNETYREVLREALRLNDPFKVYSRTLEILIDCKKLQEITDTIGPLMKKYKQHQEMWILVAKAFYEIGSYEKAKELLNRSLKSLKDIEHVPMILKFAFLHNKYDHKDDAHILFEQILTSYPKRVDIWSQYIDMLIKDEMIDAARQTLDRAVSLRLPIKKMKSLYTKFVAFEEKHGNIDSVKKVKKMAADYVKNQTDNKDE